MYLSWLSPSLLYQVSGLDMLVETLPIDVTVKIQMDDQPPVTVRRVKRKCGPTDGDMCEDFILIER